MKAGKIIIVFPGLSKLISIAYSIKIEEMKTILVSLFTLLLLQVYSQGQTPEQLRSFLQTSPSPRNAI
jgi:pantothenate kinase